MKILTLLLIVVSSAFAQAQSVNQTSAPPPVPFVNLYFYNGSSQIQYICSAQALQPVSTFYKSSTTLTNIVVSSNTGTITFSSTSYLWVGQQIVVAGSATTALNGTYPVLTVSGSTATITTSGVSNATYTDAGLTVSTTGPLLNSPVWAINIFNYASTNLATSYWAGTPAATVPQGIACSNRAQY